MKPQGRRGEVAAELHTDFPERFAERRRLWALEAGGARREVELESHWLHKGRVVLKFRGVDSIAEAERLSGCEIQVPRGERAELEPGAAYVSDLVGSELIANGRPAGRISEVRWGAGEAPLLVLGSGKDERLVPFAAEFVKRFDAGQKRIEMALPDGMLELDAPLSDEEKRHQRGE